MCRSVIVFTVGVGLITSFDVAAKDLASRTSVDSPNGHVQFTVIQDHGKHLGYTVTSRGRTVMEPSQFHFTLDGAEITDDIRITDVKTYRVHESYPWRGAHAIASNDCNGITLSLTHGSIAYTLEARAYDDGVAFRYVIPGEGSRVPDENDTFALPAKSTVWYHHERGHYEETHLRTNIADIHSGEWAMPPVTFQLPRNAGYAVITEAALTDFSGMALQANGDNSFTLGLAHRQPVSYPYELRYSSNDVQRLHQPAAITGTITTPWRVVMIGRDLNTLVNCDLVHNLCPPPDPKYFPQGINTDWLKPGRAVWKYLDGGTNTIEGTKEFCRLAGELGFEYNVVEGYWRHWTDDEIKDLVAYAHQQGVGLWFWEHSRSLHTPEAREEFFSRLERLGVVGAKIDFFDHEHKEIIDVYEAIHRDAARHHVMVNFHGSNKPTGNERTWPNELTREAIKGMEASKLADRATHDTTIPFTRYLVGPGDYTVMHFGARRANTTWAHQIATAVIFDQPLKTYAANPANILSNAAVSLIKSIPAVWDETIVLPPSRIGEVAVFARRKGDTWFLAVLNGLNAQTVHVPLSFLGKKNYDTMLVLDYANASSAIRIENRSAKRKETLAITLNSGGGFVARFTPKD